MNEQAGSGNKLLPIINNLLIMQRPPKPHFGTPVEGLGQLVERAAAAASLAAIVKRQLPESVGAHVTSAARRGDDLVVIVDSAAWADRVRYAGTAIKEWFAAAGQPIAGKVRVKVRGRDRAGDA